MFLTLPASWWFCYPRHCPTDWQHGRFPEAASNPVQRWHRSLALYCVLDAWSVSRAFRYWSHTSIKQVCLCSASTQTGIPECILVQVGGAGFPTNFQHRPLSDSSASLRIRHEMLVFAVFQLPTMLSACIELLGPAWELLSQGPSGFRPTCCTLGMPWR